MSVGTYSPIKMFVLIWLIIMSHLICVTQCSLIHWHILRKDTGLVKPRSTAFCAVQCAKSTTCTGYTILRGQCTLLTNYFITDFCQSQDIPCYKRMGFQEVSTFWKIFIQRKALEPSKFNFVWQIFISSQIEIFVVFFIELTSNHINTAMFIFWLYYFFLPPVIHWICPHFFSNCALNANALKHWSDIPWYLMLNPVLFWAFQLVQFLSQCFQI